MIAVRSNPLIIVASIIAPPRSARQTTLITLDIPTLRGFVYQYCSSRPIPKRLRNDAAVIYKIGRPIEATIKRRENGNSCSEGDIKMHGNKFGVAFARTALGVQ